LNRQYSVHSQRQASTITVLLNDVMMMRGSCRVCDEQAGVSKQI